MAQEEAKGDVLQRIASIGFILGAIPLIAFNLLFPRADDPSNVQQVLAKLADNETLSKVVFLGIAAGMWSLLIGAADVYRAISDGAAAAWVRLGFMESLWAPRWSPCGLRPAGR